jgi:thiol:disulfide interchange protein DsbD
MIWVRKLMGWVLVGMAVHFIRPVLPEALKVGLPVLVTLAAGLHLGWFDKNQASYRAFPWVKATTSAVCLIVATFWATSRAMQGPGVSWQSYSRELLEQSAKRNQPVIIDFYADWCTPCRELEEVTFHNADVVRMAEEYFTMIKVDLTQGGNPLHEGLLKQYGVKGVPTVVFLDIHGKERTDLRLVDFLPPESFLSRMVQLRSEDRSRKHRQEVTMLNVRFFFNEPNGKP